MTKVDGQSESDTRRRTCFECGELLDREGQFHPQTLCRLKQAYPSQSSWETFRQTALMLGVVLPLKAPLVRELPAEARTP